MKETICKLWKWVRRQLKISPVVLSRFRKEHEVLSGAFLYYIAEKRTNIRKSHDGIPIIYSNVDIADYNCNWIEEEVISVAAYNEIFMDGTWQEPI